MGSCTGVVSHGIEHILDIEVRHGTALLLGMLLGSTCKGDDLYYQVYFERKKT